MILLESVVTPITNNNQFSLKFIWLSMANIFVWRGSSGVERSYNTENSVAAEGLFHGVLQALTSFTWPYPRQVDCLVDSSLNYGLHYMSSLLLHKWNYLKIVYWLFEKAGNIIILRVVVSPSDICQRFMSMSLDRVKFSIVFIQVKYLWMVLVSRSTLSLSSIWIKLQIPSQLFQIINWKQIKCIINTYCRIIYIIRCRSSSF